MSDATTKRSDPTRAERSDPTRAERSDPTVEPGQPITERAEIDLRVQDPAVLEEIELYSELIIVAGASEGRLSAAEIDRVLGLRRSKLADSH
jgi:hypothetical protein